jgi:hypothetical protein
MNMNNTQDYFSQQNQESTSKQIQGLITRSKIDPQVFVQLGQLAEAAIQDKNQYPAFVKFIIDSGLEKDDSDLKEMDYQVLASFAVMGKVAQGMSQGA